MKGSERHKAWKRRLIRRLCEAQNWKCCYCGRSMTLLNHVTLRATIEHVQPRSKNGRLNWDNCVAACAKCNRERGNGRAERFGQRRARQIGREERLQALISVEHLEQRA